MQLPSRAVSVLKEKGVVELLSRSSGLVYRKASPYLPKTGYRVDNSVRISKRPIFAQLIPYSGYRDRKDSEDGIVSCHQEVTHNGDSVTVVGGGKGITAVRAAKIVGTTGQVTIYEG